jgi:hypothetical protein
VSDTDEGWSFSDDAPMFVARDEIREAEETFEREVKEARAKGEHYLMAIVGYKVDMSGWDNKFAPLALGRESLRLAPNIGCFLCETPYTKGMDPRCPGEPVP